MSIAATEPALSDEQLLTHYRQAPPETRRDIAGELFSRHYVRVERWCYRFSRERESAADLTQEVFLKAHRHLDSFRGTSRFSTWLYTIARNEWLNHMQKKVPAMADADEELAGVPALDPAPDEVAAQNSRARRLHEFLASTLTETELTVFTLHYGDGIPLDNISGALGLENRSGAKAYIVSARRKLARAAGRLFSRGESL